MVGRRRSQTISRTWSSMFLPMFTADSQQRRISLSRDRAGDHDGARRFAGGRKQNLASQHLEDLSFENSGLTTDTRFGSILSRLISVETGFDETAAMCFGFAADSAFCSSPGPLLVFDCGGCCLFRLFIGQNKRRFAVRLWDSGLYTGRSACCCAVSREAVSLESMLSFSGG